jgi:hypothetical protein
MWSNILSKLISRRYSLHCDYEVPCIKIPFFRAKFATMASGHKTAQILVDFMSQARRSENERPQNGEIRGPRSGADTAE